MPIKIRPNLVEYVKKLNKTMSYDEIQFFVGSLPPNPRKIKLALNSFHFALHNKVTKYFESSRTEWIYIRTLMSWIAISHHHRDIAETAKIAPISFLKAALICSYTATQPALHDFLERYEANQNGDKQQSYRLGDNLEIEHKDMNQNMRKILRICMAENQYAFNILNQYGSITNIRGRDKNKSHAFSSIVSEFDEHLEILRAVIRHTTL